MASPRSDAVKVEDPDATRLLRDAAAPAGVRPGADDGRRPRPAGDAGPARLRRGADWRGLHGAVGGHPLPRPLHPAGPPRYASGDPPHRRPAAARPPTPTPRPAP